MAAVNESFDKTGDNIEMSGLERTRGVKLKPNCYNYEDALNLTGKFD